MLYTPVASLSIAELSWTGDATDNRALPHGLGKTPSMFIISGGAASGECGFIDWANRSRAFDGTGDAQTAFDSTNVYVSTDNFNLNGVVYRGWAIG